MPKPTDGALRGVKAIQQAHMHALTTGEGRGLTTAEMAEVFDRETGLPALERCRVSLEAVLCNHTYKCICAVCNEARATLAEVSKP